MIGTGLVRCGLVCFALVAGCHSTRDRAKSEDVQSRVGHVVIFWLKQPGDPEARRRVIEASHGFSRLPGVLRVEAGEVLPSPRPNVEKSYDVAVVMWFRDLRALEDYQVHPHHKAMLQEIGPSVERVVVYDFQTAPHAAKK